MTTEFPYDVRYTPDHPGLLRRLGNAIKMLAQGKTNNTGTVTLTANSATTTITEADGKIGLYTQIVLTPTTANAAAALTNIYLSARDVANKTITLTHTNNAQVDRTFLYHLVG